MVPNEMALFSFIARRQKIVKRDLADAEPAVLEAQSTVRNIKRQYLQDPQQRNRMIKHRGYTSTWSIRDATIQGARFEDNVRSPTQRMGF